MSRAKYKYYDDLIIAIIVQASDDYDWSMSMTAPGKEHKATRSMKKALREDVEKFLASDWYEELTNVAPEIIKKKAVMFKATDRTYNWLDVLYSARKLEHRRRKRQRDD